MPNKRQLERSFSMPIMKRNRTDELVKESHDCIYPIDIFRDSKPTELDLDLKNYEMYKAGLHECEYIFGMVNRLEIIEDVFQENNSTSRCPLCLQVFSDLNQLRLHHCFTDDFDIFKGGNRSSTASTALTSTRKDIGKLLDVIPRTHYVEYQNNSGVDK